MSTKQTDRPFQELAELIHSEWDRIEQQAELYGAVCGAEEGVDFAVREIEKLLARSLKKTAKE